MCIGFDAELFNTHSFHIGIATTAEAVGLLEPQIKSLAHWRSNTYQGYICPSPLELVMLLKKLVSGDDAVQASKLHGHKHLIAYWTMTHVQLMLHLLW